MTRRETLESLSIAVLLGGRSGEREISLAVIEGLQGAGYAPRVIDTGDARWWRELEGVDLAFNIQHGSGGEDGVTQGLLAAMGIVGTGSGVFASALAMDKLRCKQLWRAVGLPTADFAVVNAETDFASRIGRIRVSGRRSPLSACTIPARLRTSGRCSMPGAAPSSSLPARVRASAWPESPPPRRPGKPWRRR